MEVSSHLHAPSVLPPIFTEYEAALDASSLEKSNFASVGNPTRVMTDRRLVTGKVCDLSTKRFMQGCNWSAVSSKHTCSCKQRHFSTYVVPPPLRRTAGFASVYSYKLRWILMLRCHVLLGLPSYFLPVGVDQVFVHVSHTRRSSPVLLFHSP